jgi:hypothetical protein
VGAIRRSAGEDGFGLLGVVISLLILAVVSFGALAALGGGGAATGSHAQTFIPSVTNAYDVQAQSTLATAMQSVRDGAIANGGLSGLNLSQYGVLTGPSGSPEEVSGATSDASASPGGPDGPLGGGSVTLAVASKSGTCWFVWLSGSDTWFGFEPDVTTCAALPLTTVPTPGRASPGTIGWQHGSFPVTG